MPIEIIETLSGTGQLYRRGAFIADLDYDLTVWQGVNQVRRSGTKAQSYTTGAVRGDKRLLSRLSYDNKNSDLRLQDGRRLEFFFAAASGKVRGMIHDE